MITIKDILDNEKFSDLKLMNSQADLNRRISTIESTETPDIASYLTPHAFLITTGMVYKDNQKDLINLIRQLNNLPCAGLGIKLGRFLDKLDVEVIEIANELNFPLIQIPLDTTLGDIFQKLLSHVWKNENAQLLYSLNIQKKFSDLMIRDAPLDVLIRYLSHNLKKPIALVDPFGNITNTSSNIKSKIFKNTLRNIVEELSFTADSNEPIDIQLNEKHINFNMATIYPINMASYYPYYLIIFDAQNMEYPLSHMAIKQATLILAFTLYKNLRISYSTLSGKEEFLKDLININKYETLNDQQLLFKGEKYNFINSNFYQIIVAEISNKNKFSNNTSVMEEWYILIYNWIDTKLNKNIEYSLLLPDRTNYRYIILLQKPVNNLINRLISYRKILKKTLDLDINFSIGNSVQSINSIRLSYQEALEAIQFGEAKEGLDFIKHYSQLSTSDLLNLLPKEQLDNFISNTLKSLAYPKDEFTQDLKQTLKTFLDLNCNITDTADKLFIHRNTVKYRIDKCREILNKDVTDSSYSLKLRLSLLYTENKIKEHSSNSNIS
ncbi:MAG TPA: PucR family transcriptional regulator ligand-binding domain-containing protein [Tissierellaceae bacterium]|nr:PucR family transcriptional regulator ligand-binding domain-containing protein [Tissierellaceae bacterium]